MLLGDSMCKVQLPVLMKLLPAKQYYSYLFLFQSFKSGLQKSWKEKILTRALEWVKPVKLRYDLDKLEATQ